MSVDVVSDIEPRVQYTAAAAQTDFDYPFPIFTDADLVVDVDGVTQALTTDYTVTGAGDDTGGTITFLSAMAGSEVVTIYRDLAIERLTDFQQNGRFSSASFNDELDKIIMILQQLDSADGRALRLSAVDATSDSDMQLPAPSARAEKFLYFNAAGDPEMATGAVAGSVLSQSTVGAALYPIDTAETAAGLVSADLTLHYPYFDVRRYGAVGNGVTDDGVAINTAANVVRAAQYARKIDTVSTPRPKLTFGGGLVYRVNSSIWLGTNDSSVASYLGQFVHLVDMGGSTIVGYTDGDPIIDWTGGNSIHGRRIYNGQVVGESTTMANVGILLARNSIGTSIDNAQIDVDVTGHFTVCAVYNYAAERVRMGTYRFWNYISTGAPAVVVTNANKYSVTSPNCTIATGAQSMIDVSFERSDIRNQAAVLSATYSASCVELWGAAEVRFRDAFINATSVNNEDLVYMATVGAVNPERIGFLHSSFHSDNGTGVSVRVAGVIRDLEITHCRSEHNDLLALAASSQVDGLTFVGNGRGNDNIDASAASAFITGGNIEIRGNLNAPNSGCVMDIVQRSGGTITTHADFTGTIRTTGGSFTRNGKSGTATLAAGTKAVTIEPDEPDSNYQIVLTGNTAETFTWASKATTGFTINSSVGGSTASVDWLIVRG
jgi:hypothetical protein